MKSKLKDLGLFVGVAIVFTIIFAIIRMFITPIYVSGNSMYPTLEDGYLGWSVNIKDDTEIKRGDIVVVKTEEEKYIIKRVIALPGEEVYCSQGKIYIDGKAIEDYTNAYTDDFDAVVLGEDEYFVMGDNRSNSKDSRHIGAITKDELSSVGIFVVSPFTEFGGKK